MKTMKYAGTMALVMAGILAGQTALACVLDFHTAELLGKTAMSALFFYSLIRLVRTARRARA